MGRREGSAYRLGGLRAALAVALLGSIGVSGAWPGAALAAAGDLDPTFGRGGKVTTSFSVNDHANAMAIQADGKIVLAGAAGGAAGGPGQLFVSRLNHDGSLDPSFGSGGMARTSFGGFDDFARAVAIQTDGKIVAAGHSELINGRSRFVLARFNRDGSLDPTFGRGGRVVEQTLSGANGVALQRDGKIVAVGDGFNAATGNTDFAVVRYNGDGSRDPSFDADGLVFTDFGSFEEALAVAIQGDGKIVVAGAGGRGGALARLNRDGSLDPTFGRGGRVLTVASNAVALQADGKIVVAGAGAGGGGFALARLERDGRLDPSFGSGGRVTTDFGGGRESANAVAIQGNGKIVAAGGTNGFGSGGDFALARYTQHGSLDPSFGDGGKVTTDFRGVEFAIGVAIQGDGRIVAAGYAAGGAHSAVARYLAS
jgi:uncharacterized delta-60 repeat protein